MPLPGVLQQSRFLKDTDQDEAVIYSDEPAGASVGKRWASLAQWSPCGKGISHHRRGHNFGNYLGDRQCGRVENGIYLLWFSLPLSPAGVIAIPHVTSSRGAFHCFIWRYGGIPTTQSDELVVSSQTWPETFTSRVAFSLAVRQNPMHPGKPCARNYSSHLRRWETAQRRSISRTVTVRHSRTLSVVMMLQQTSCWPHCVPCAKYFSVRANFPSLASPNV